MKDVIVNMEKWVGRVALVTGASVGTGAAITRAVVKHGMKVVGCARNVQQIEVTNRVFYANVVIDAGPVLYSSFSPIVPFPPENLLYSSLSPRGKKLL